ncbi:MAG TPA: hypothetical protein VE959_32940 [Bryobacteraceae bacterium]|nr:hypothetical protein [Bryobacteraceae bacterium]
MKDHIAAVWHSPYSYILTSIALLTPCYWQPRLQAGDLSSHIYNAWLVRLIEQGRTPGLVVVRQWTNVLFDWILSGLFRVFGAEAAQRIAVSLAVLIFVWGAFAFVSVVAGRRSWHLMPCISMLAYGWVFHMGFFNFYLSLGLCFWALAAAWKSTPRRLGAAIGILVPAFLAHALPVVWTIGLLTYVLAARRQTAAGRVCLTTGFVLALAVFHGIVGHLLVTRWSPVQVTFTTGLDQLWVFDTKYYLVLMGLLAVWGLLFAGLVRGSGVQQVAGSIPFHLCVISAAVVFILPSTVLIPGFAHALSYIAERMSLGVAVCICALLGTVRPRRLERYALVAVAFAFFGFVYSDERALNSFEDRMEDVVTQLAPGQRVVSPITDTDMRTNALTHMIDRICVGRCYSYANYEASTAQFRLRAVRQNPFVAATYRDSWDMQTGKYVVKQGDLPLYKVDLENDGKMVVRSLKAGSPCGITRWKTLVDLLPNS